VLRDRPVIDVAERPDPGRILPEFGVEAGAVIPVAGGGQAGAAARDDDVALIAAVDDRRAIALVPEAGGDVAQQPALIDRLVAARQRDLEAQTERDQQQEQPRRREPGPR
jgi:hypothetical protein